MRSPVSRLLPLAALILLSGCAAGRGGPALSPALPKNGPAADYPVVIGEPFVIGNKTYTPDDTLNYDAVGYAIVGEGAGAGVAASHKTLPLPSYVEVTDLQSGRTALVRVETRGPMRNDALLELTPAAAKQLGLVAGVSTPVRVRRVNPPEAERAMLRAGEQAPLRMDTPSSLLTVLKRKLDDQQPLGGKSAATITPVDPDLHPKGTAIAMPVSESVDAKADAGAKSPAPPSSAPSPAANPRPPAMAASKEPAARQANEDKKGISPTRSASGCYVQVGAFSTRERAEKAAAPLGANVSQSGKYWLVRLGPLDSAAATSAALEKARKAGYKDAIVRRFD